MSVGGRKINVGLAGEREDGTTAGSEDTFGLLLELFRVVAAVEE